MRTHEQNERTSPYHTAFEPFLQGNDDCHCADYGDGHLHTDLYEDVEGDPAVMLSGRKVVVSSWMQKVPRVQLSPDFNAASDDCIKGMNQFLLEMFGMRETFLELSDGTIAVSHKTYAALKDAA